MGATVVLFAGQVRCERKRKAQANQAKQKKCHLYTDIDKTVTVKEKLVKCLFL